MHIYLLSRKLTRNKNTLRRISIQVKKNERSENNIPQQNIVYRKITIIYMRDFISRERRKRMIINSYGLKNNRMIGEQPLDEKQNVNSDDNINIRNIFILAGFFSSLKRHRFCCFGNMTVFYFSLLCRRTHAHKIDAYSLLLFLSLLLLAGAIASFFLSFSLSLSFSYAFFFVSCLMSTLLKRETYTSNKLSLDINRTLDFIKYFLFLTCFFSLPFLSSNMRKTAKEQNRK